jgi:hypothetical protein
MTPMRQVRSPKRVQIKFEEGQLSTPQLVDDLQLPVTLELGGQMLDLAPLQSVAQQLRSALQPLDALLKQVEARAFTSAGQGCALSLQYTG